MHKTALSDTQRATLFSIFAGSRDMYGIFTVLLCVFAVVNALLELNKLFFKCFYQLAGSLVSEAVLWIIAKLNLMKIIIHSMSFIFSHSNVHQSYGGLSGKYCTIVEVSRMFHSDSDMVFWL